jgi:membrane protein
LSETRRLFKDALDGWWSDRAMSLGAAIAFNTIFSLAPMLLAAIAVAGLAFGREAAQGAIVAELGGFLGKDGASALEAMILSASDVGSGVAGTAIGFATFLLLVTGAIVELQDDLNVIWKVQGPRTSGISAFLHARLLSFVVVLGIGFVLLVSLVVDAGLAAMSAYLEGRLARVGTLLQVLNTVFGFGVAVLLFAMIFKILPDVDLEWRDVWTGALVTGTLFTAGKALIGLYLGRSNFASTYGAAGSIITLLGWVYYSSLILLYGAEFTKVYAERRGSRRRRDRRPENSQDAAPPA